MSLNGSRTEERRRSIFVTRREAWLSVGTFAVAGLVAGLTGSPGCLLAGAARLLGLRVGLASGATPVLVVRRA